MFHLRSAWIESGQLETYFTPKVVLKLVSKVRAHNLCQNEESGKRNLPLLIFYNSLLQFIVGFVSAEPQDCRRNRECSRGLLFPRSLLLVVLRFLLIDFFFRNGH